ncbi:MAG: nucleotide sugar dehydrogenase [Congregibacter sp.]
MKNESVATQTIAVVGLGYVGLPLAIAFGERLPTMGFDLDERKLTAYRSGTDPSGEVADDEFAAAQHLEFTSSAEHLVKADVIIVVVPTPIDAAKRPDLSPLESATRTVGENMKSGAIIVFESTVFPGCTEDFCVPILERSSGMRWAGRSHGGYPEEGFYVGYSPERINPGDKSRRLPDIVKVVSGDTDQTLSRLVALYASVVEAGIHAAPSIKVAEAAKVIENTQRDLNIALVNELAMIFERLAVDTLDVLAAASTKWNFLPFKPGLVGGHCIGVDPYYLTYKAQSVGFHPAVILAGRRVNDGMSKFIAEQTVKTLAARGVAALGARVLVFGVAFKEDCPDLRNSRVPEIVDELADYGCQVTVHDPLADPEDAETEFGIELTALDDLEQSEAIILAVPHATFRERPLSQYVQLLESSGILIDVKGMFDRDECASAGVSLWRL